MHRRSSGPADVFARRESAVRYYSRLWPTTFSKASGAYVSDTAGNKYLDFSSGAGALNYGHNPPELMHELSVYIASGSIIHALDTFTAARAEFLTTLEETLLNPRDMDYVVQFPGPTGANSVEAALKLARKYTGRETVVAFDDSFHGMSLGALALCGNVKRRASAGVPLPGVVHLPYGEEGAVVDYFDNASHAPAAVILECVQGEGGVNVGPPRWLRTVQDYCNRHKSLLIVDDIQMGCGRTGRFFSFEGLLEPDIVCLSKSLSGIGLPLSLVLIRRQFDVWEPGEHNGTFRSNSLALVTATAALRHFWSDATMSDTTAKNNNAVALSLQRLEGLPNVVGLRTAGLATGIELTNSTVCRRVLDMCFSAGVLVEAAGPTSSVLKVMPPLTTAPEDLADGLDLVVEAIISAAPNASPS